MIVIYVLTAIEKMDLAKLKEVGYKSFFLHYPNDYFADEWSHVFSNQLQSFIKIDFCSTRDYHEEGCSTAVMFNLGHQIHLMIGVCIWKRFLPTVLFGLFTQEVNAEADQNLQIVNYFILDIHIFENKPFQGKSIVVNFETSDIFWKTRVSLEQMVCKYIILKIDYSFKNNETCLL